MTETEIVSLDELHNSFKRIRDHKEGFYTNFFLNPFVASLWIKHKLLMKVSISKTDFFLRSDLNFAHLYYCAASEHALHSALIEFMNQYGDRIITIDILGNETGIKATTDLFLQNGFNNFTSLVRMTRKQSKPIRSLLLAENDISENFVEKVQESDLTRINTLLHDYFDCYADQLPLLDELNYWMKKGSILVCKEQHDIQGFIIYEELGFTSYLRYWFVHPDYREKRIGSKLINTFFYETQTASRHLFWVNSLNNNAIKRYLHYGFIPEDMVDKILINRQIKYGKQNN